MSQTIDLDAPLPGLRYERRADGIAVLTLDRAERGNALAPNMQPVVRAVWEDVRDDPEVRVAVVTAAGERHFCTGFDVAEAEGEGADDVFADRPLVEAVHWSPHTHRVWKPVICAVQGLCVGGGLHFVVDADVVVASENAAFLDAHVNVGMVGAIENIGLAKRLPLGAALRMTLQGRSYRMPARRAYELGLVDELVPSAADALPAALEIAKAMLGNSPQAMALSKQAIWESLERGYGDALENGWKLLRSHWGHPDFEEGPRAFEEKREPRWNPDPKARILKDVNPAFDADTERFRAEVRAFLEDWRDLDGFFDQGHRWPRVRAFFAALGERGWLSLGWPAEAGGAARDPLLREYVLWDEVAYVRAARPPLASGIVAKTLARAGDAAQRERWLPPIARGEIHFSLAYSEPEAGSDLASLRCRAERRGDVYVLSGQKCWQSYAQDMDYLWTLARTGAPDERSRGLSLFIVEKHAPGVRVAPLPTLDGDQLNEVFFDGVEVPADQRVGPEGGAWPLMGQALADERHIQFPPGRVRRDLEEVVAWARERGLGADPRVRTTLADLAVRVAEAEASGLAVLDAMLRGASGTLEAAANKVVHTLVCQEIARAALDFGGPEAVVTGERVEFLWRQSLWETIGGGTTEIMRGVVAKQALGLGGRH